MQQTISVNQTVSPSGKFEFSKIISRYLAYTKSQDDHQVLWYILGLVFIPCVAIIISVFTMHFLAFPYMAYYMTSTFIMYYAIVVAHMSGAKATVYISIFILNIIYLVGSPLLVLFFS